MQERLTFKALTEANIPEISMLGQQLNPTLTIEQTQNYLKEMFDLSTYRCFGLYQDQTLIGICGGWITVRLYSGKQLEIDHFIVDPALQSNGLGKLFLEFIEEWASQNGCKTIELNTYVQNSKSHKFYFNSGFSILGFHFWKGI